MAAIPGWNIALVLGSIVVGRSNLCIGTAYPGKTNEGPCQIALSREDRNAALTFQRELDSMRIHSDQLDATLKRFAPLLFSKCHHRASKRKIQEMISTLREKIEILRYLEAFRCEKGLITEDFPVNTTHACRGEEIAHRRLADCVVTRYNGDIRNINVT